MKSKATISPAVQAANTLTARWCARLGSEDFVASGAGLWPLLALLASAADESAAEKLAQAIGRPVGTAQQEALGLIDVLTGGQSTSAALGIWTRKDIPLKEDWAAPLPDGVVDTLTDKAALDRWASEKTDGLIEEFPLDLTEETLVVLATALTARVRWRVPFDSEPRDGRRIPGLEDPGPADRQLLTRRTSDLAVAAVLDESVTRVVVEGDGDVDVHLLLGDKTPAEVLGTGLRELSGESTVRLATELGEGNHSTGLTVTRTQSSRPSDILRIELPSFEIRNKHDLLKNADLFGLGLLLDVSTSHLPHLSAVPLAVSSGVQDVLARFFAEGFEAAAVTAFGIVAGSAMFDSHEITYVDVTFDRPFGFIAVHRPSRLAVVSGWVSSPFQEGPAE